MAELLVFRPVWWVVHGLTVPAFLCVFIAAGHGIGPIGLIVFGLDDTFRGYFVMFAVGWVVAASGIAARAPGPSRMLTGGGVFVSSVVALMAFGESEWLGVTLVTALPYAGLTVAVLVGLVVRRRRVVRRAEGPIGGGARGFPVVPPRLRK